MTGYRTDLAMESTGGECGTEQGVSVEQHRRGESEITWVRITSPQAARRLGKPQGAYWTMWHPNLPLLSPAERIPVARVLVNQPTPDAWGPSTNGLSPAVSESCGTWGNNIL